MHPIKPCKPINELEQIVVDVPNRYHGMDQIIIVREADTGLHVIGNGESHLPIHHYGTAGGAMCSYRAAMTVRGHVLLRGAQVRPEDYLKSWRSVVPVSLSELEGRYGIALFADLELDLTAERQTKWGGYSEGISKLTSLDQFLEAYPIDAQGFVSIQLDNLLSFSDLKTFHANRARESGGNYEPKSRITFVAQQTIAVATTSTPVANANTQSYQQAELI